MGRRDPGTARPTSFPCTSSGDSGRGSTATSSRSCARWCPRDMDPRVGVREMDIAHPGFGIDSVVNPPDGTVALEGALLAPSTVRRGLAARNTFVGQVEPVLNAPADGRDSGTTDPIVAPPIYACWHAQVDRVTDVSIGGNWPGELNLDPRYRAAAGLGARVIRANQEQYMRLAWDQIGDVLTVNRQIRRAQLATKAAAALYVKSFVPLPAERAVAIAGPVLAKLRASSTTLASMVSGSRLPRAAVSPALRKQMRPRGRLARKVLDGPARVSGLAAVLGRINDGHASAAPPRSAPGGATLEQINEAMTRPQQDLPGPTSAGGISGVLQLLSGSGLGAAAIDSTPAQPTFGFAAAGTDATIPPSGIPPHVKPTVPGDTIAAADMRMALAAFGKAVSIRVDPVAPRAALDLAFVHQSALASLEPHTAFAARFAPLFRVAGVDVQTFARTRYANASITTAAGTLQEVMTYPDIKAPAYAPLQTISSEYLLPNLQPGSEQHDLIAGIQPAVHRGVPRRPEPRVRARIAVARVPDGSAGQLLQAVLGRVELRRPASGARPSSWPKTSRTFHPCTSGRRRLRSARTINRSLQGGDQQVVLVIRGDLLKRYPSTFIYAQKAAWGTGPRVNRLVLSDETGDVFATAPQDPRLAVPALHGPHRPRPALRRVRSHRSRGPRRSAPRRDRRRARARRRRHRVVLRRSGSHGRAALRPRRRDPGGPVPAEVGQPRVGESRSVGRAGRRRVEAVRVASGRRGPGRCRVGDERGRRRVRLLPGTRPDRHPRPAHAREPTGPG